MAKQHSVYKVSFNNQGKIYEIYARSVSQGDLFGFVDIEEIVFGERSQVLLDPTEESLKHEFQGVKRTMVPIHSIVRIDEVEREGTARITSPDGDADNVANFPMAILPGPDKPPKGPSGKGK